MEFRYNIYNLVLFLIGVKFCNAGYGYGGSPSASEVQSDVSAPAYASPNLNRQSSRGNLYSRKSYSYHGTKTAYGGGTKTSYGGTKTSYGGTKTMYTGTKTGYGGSHSYTGSKTWNSETGGGANYQEFHDNAGEEFSPKCTPPCQNNGICVAPDVCHCPEDYHGTYCEFHKKPCLTYPPLPMNSKRQCTSEMCTITCAPGHRFIDGSTVANLKCAEGQWVPTRADLTSIPDCDPECSPPCLNGGVCLSVDTCQCPQEYRGPQCQYAASACDLRKLSFNGGYKCSGDGERFACTLACPLGSRPSSPFAERYTCLYSTGRFEPQPVPNCLFNDALSVTSSYQISGYSQSYYETQYENRSAYGSYSQQHSEDVAYGASSAKDLKKPMTIVVQDLTPKPGRCLSWAGTHYKTFDGVVYSFQSPCQHILIRDAKVHKFSVAVKQGKCKRGIYCPSEITIFIEDKEYVLSTGDDGEVAFRTPRRALPVPATLPGIRVAMTTNYVTVNLDGMGLSLKWDTDNFISVEASPLLWNNTEGLCGRLDGNPETDVLKKDGSKAVTKTAFAASWQVNKIGDICEDSPTETSACAAKSDDNLKEARHFCTRIFSSSKFRKCSEVMDVSLLIEACEWDYCACASASDSNGEECACRTVAVYAKECLKHGVQEMKMWRDDETCPMSCPEGKVYMPCGPDAQPSCEFPTITAKSDNSSCVEGCFCGAGLLLGSGRCVTKEQCPCRLRNRVFQPGHTVAKDCNTCTCTGGSWACSRMSCGARCGVVGDPHYTTFDGTTYDFMGRCSYYLLQGEGYKVTAENVACSGAISDAMNLLPSTSPGKPSCTKAVTIKYGSSKIHLKQGGLILVNSKEVTKLPMQLKDNIVIRAASSLFVIVQLPNSVDVWWDGNTRVFIDVPPEMNNKTKGLCGTFNYNQKDDFLTPEGDTEQSAHAFANKWKTNEACSDVDIAEPEHPCKANVQNKEAAEKYCGKLKSELFEACHWHVDVTSYYESCLYDVCACDGDISRCLCPILGDYAMTCASKGVKIQWRYSVKECELSCVGGQEYSVCGDSCARSCADIALGDVIACKPHCVEGCNCPQGQMLDESGACVPVGLCPCYHKGMKFQPGYKEVRPGRRELELCTCVGGRWSCTVATQADAAQFPAASDVARNCRATDKRQLVACSAEPLTCKNMHLPPTPTSSECRPGCQCMSGYVLDSHSNSCVPPELCPCHHGGRSYADGELMKEECNTCTCKSGNWSCTSHACVGICSSWGDSHITTFDGNEFDFEGVCSYLLAKGAMGQEKDEFQVKIQNVPCGTTGATCSKSVTLTVGRSGSQETVTLSQHVPLPEKKSLKRIKLRPVGSFIFLDVPSMGISVQWDRATRVYVKLDAMWKNRVKGLCGNFNYDLRDDFQTPSSGGIAESSALIFADSWKLRATCPRAQEVKDHCKQRPERKEWAISVCGKLKEFPFTLCHSEVPPSSYISRCSGDACACDAGEDCGCACAALAHYAHVCADRGVHYKWRTRDLCPMQCDEECSNYEACIDACPLETCDNTLMYHEIKISCTRDTCVEGCKPKKSCPEGEVYTNSSHQACIPRNKCRPVCLTLPTGQVVLEGEVMVEDACHTCTCSNGEAVCSGQPCFSTEKPTSPPPSAPAPSPPKSHDEPLKCTTGWTQWVTRGTPDINAKGESVEKEPLPKENELDQGQPMCKSEQMTKIECRTVTNHTSAKETGLNAECSLENGLVCKESEKTCPDFEIRVYCDCEDVFQCLNADHPSYPHPKNCQQFYECTPDLQNPNKPHTVLKSCDNGLMYNPVAMVCDWPASVAKLRPECGIDNEENLNIKSTVPLSTATWATATLPTTTERLCPNDQVYSECAYRCDKMCDFFKKEMLKQGKCIRGQKCIEGCIDKSVANIKCDFGALWRDEATCVPVRDCTCAGTDGRIVKPGGTQTDGCVKCQCLDNEFHCDSSDCTLVPNGPTHAPIVVTVPTFLTTEPTIVSTTTSPTIGSTSPTIGSTSPTIGLTSPTIGSTITVKTTTVQEILITKSIVSPPPQCDESRYRDLLWGDEPLPDSAFSASSIANELFEPQHAELNGHPLDITAGSWNPAHQDTNQFIQIAFPSRTPIYGVILQGSPLFDEYVTSYEVLYGDDGNVFHAVTTDDGSHRVFQGPTDHEKPVKQMLTPPIEAKYIRIRPLSWHVGISLRLELIGCEQAAQVDKVTKPSPPPCLDLLGLESGLPLESVEVSSNPATRGQLALNSEQPWKPLYSTPGEWVMFDFGSPRNITGIKTKGGPNGYVTSYHIYYSTELPTFNPIVNSDKVALPFPGNYDGSTVVFNQFTPPVHARYLKYVPVKWKGVIEIRVEPVGCFLPYPVTLSITNNVQSTTPITFASCEICAGAQIPISHSCDCQSRNKYYDGENCVSKDQCPCFIGFMSYPVGASFKGANCDECICKLGGVTDCRPVQICKCSPNLVPKLSTDTCECTCSPCPEGTKICPTSGVCLPLARWCDGLQDCPDDETGCTTSTTESTTTSTTTVEPTVGTTKIAEVQVQVVTEKIMVECPKVDCPPGYHVVYTSPTPSPTNPHRGGYKRYYTRGGKSFTKGGTKGGVKGYSAAPPPQSTLSFTLSKPISPSPSISHSAPCRQFKCVPKLPSVEEQTNVVCEAPKCPDKYTLKMEQGSGACPVYSCVPPPEKPVFCELTGRTFTTFDGAQYKYDICYHILARENRLDAWTVLVRKKCRIEGCLNELLVRQDDQLILVKPNLMIEYDNYEYTVEQTNMICFRKNSFDLYRMGKGLSISSRKYNFTVWYGADGDVKVGVFKSSMGLIDGLCGAFDGNPTNDRQLPTGNIALSIEDFGNAWAKPGLPKDACQTKVISVDKQKKVWEMCKAITLEPLSRCKSINLDKWLSICVEKVCECEDLIYNGTKKTFEQCRCQFLEQFVAECVNDNRSIELDGWRLLNDCPSSCPPPLVWAACPPVPEPSCVAPRVQHAAAACAPACLCPDGLLKKGEMCVTPDRCSQCTCKVLNSPSKIVSFERDDLPFGGNCTYLVTRDRNATGIHKFEVYVTNGACHDNPSVTCTKVIHIFYGKNIVRVARDPSSQKLLLAINDEVIYKHPLKTSWLETELVNGQNIDIKLPEASVELSILQSKLELSISLPPYIYSNATEGLCGACAGDHEHLIMRNGTETLYLDEYGNSWKADAATLATLKVPPQESCGEVPKEKECTPPPPESNPCYNLLNKDKFGACHAILDPTPYIDACETDTCAGAAHCSALERYAAECRNNGICLQWRGDELCPYSCSSPLVYHPCMTCEPTCDNYEDIKTPGKCTQQMQEGCFCSEGKVRVNDTCIEPSKCFPCDANKEHYAGDEWQKDACTKCTCTKLPEDSSAHILCSVQNCLSPVCTAGEDLVTHTVLGQCCPDYSCVAKPRHLTECQMPKKMECAFAQVLKRREDSNGCVEYTCECIPQSECPPLPDQSSIDILDPGLKRTIDNTGCCPKLKLVCDRDSCRGPPECPMFRSLAVDNNTECCPHYSCVPPRDKCVTTLEYEADPKGGERARTRPETVLKDLDSAWLDGPCRSCRCELTSNMPTSSCVVEYCPAPSSGQVLLASRPVPFQCCPIHVPVACIHNEQVYKVGAQWNSSSNPCESYQCFDVQGKLEKRITKQTCADCPKGSKRTPPGPSECCGRCERFACLLETNTAVEEKKEGDEWSSADFCEHYTCSKDSQIVSTRDICPQISEEMNSKFVLRNETVPGECCPKTVATACKVDREVYQEGSVWSTSDPCTNYTCARDESGQLAHVVVPIEATWRSPDNCTTYSCTARVLSVSRTTCPDTSACPPQDLYNDTCCVMCRERPANLDNCGPEPVPASSTIGLIKLRDKTHGVCVNNNPVKLFKECRGNCASGTLYNNQTGVHDSQCLCCQAVHYLPIEVELTCSDGVKKLHRVASPASCRCLKCGEQTEMWPTGKPGEKIPNTKERTYSDIPDIYRRFGER